MSIMQKMLGIMFAMILVTGCSSQQSGDEEKDAWRLSYTRSF